jgi:hypothetical protein
LKFEKWCRYLKYLENEKFTKAEQPMIYQCCCVNTKEREEMGIAEEVFADYAGERHDIEAARRLAEYLFQRLLCGKYRLWVDAD